MGIGSCFVYISTLGAPSHWFSKHRGIALGVVVSGSPFGALCMNPVLQMLITTMGGTQWPLRIMAIVALVLVSVCGALIKSKPCSALVSTNTNHKAAIRSLIFSKTFMLVLAMWVVISLGYIFPVIIIVGSCLYLHLVYAADLGIKTLHGSLLVSVFNVGVFIGCILFGLVADKVGYFASFSLSSFCAGLAIFGLWLPATTFSMMCAFTAVYGFFVGGFLTTFSLLVVAVFGIFVF